MTSALFEVNKKYWTDRAPSYSQVNQEELAYAGLILGATGSISES